MQRKIIKRFLSTGLIWLWISILILALDRYTKIWMVQHLNYHEPFAIFPFLNFTLSYNTGAAFSFLDQASGWQNIVLSGLAFIVSAAVLLWLKNLAANKWLINIALCCILGGALANAWDRILYGYVIDFLSFHWSNWYFAIFNLADSAICLGTFLLCLHWLMDKPKS